MQLNFAAFGGKCPNTIADSVSIPQNHKLQHVDPGLLSVSADGSHFALTMRRALPLDDGYKVIGRVSKGMEFLTALNDVDVDAEEKPEIPICIDQCGLTNHKGENETFSTAGGNLGKNLSQGTRDGLEAASQQAQNALKDGLKRTGAPVRKAPHKRRHVAEAVSSDDSSDSGHD